MLPFSRPYPGRGIVIGRSSDADHMVHIYFVTGRSTNSQNRLLVQDGDVVRTDVADPSVPHDPTYTIYNAVQPSGSHIVVANGDHGDEIAEAPGDPLRALGGLGYEDDPPIFTPRIAGVSDNGGGVWLAKVTRGESSAAPVANVYVYRELDPGSAVGIQTYTGDDASPSGYDCDPFVLEFTEAKDLSDEIWTALRPDYRVAIAVVSRSLIDGTVATRIVNERG